MATPNIAAVSIDPACSPLLPNSMSDDGGLLVPSSQRDSIIDPGYVPPLDIDHDVSCSPQPHAYIVHGGNDVEQELLSRKRPLTDRDKREELNTARPTQRRTSQSSSTTTTNSDARHRTGTRTMTSGGVATWVAELRQGVKDQCLQLKETFRYQRGRIKVLAPGLLRRKAAALMETISV